MKAEYFDEKVGWTKTLLIGFQHVLTTVSYTHLTLPTT